MVRDVKLSNEARLLLIPLAGYGVGTHQVVTYALSLYSLGQFHYAVSKTLPELEAEGFITYEKQLLFSHFDGHDNDFDPLTESFLDLLRKGEKTKAKNLAELAGYPILNTVLSGKVSIDEILELESERAGEGIYFGLYPNLLFEITIKARALNWISKNLDTLIYNTNANPKKEENSETALSRIPYFEESSSRLWTGEVFVQFKKTSKQHDTLRAFWTDSKKDWLFDELFEIVDFTKKGKWKILYDQFLAIQTKLDVAGAKDFFVITTQGVSLNRSYLEPIDDAAPGKW
ncbi:MAG: hypothetical protein KBC68_01250 [Candidatus Pacebacteria bacterium]|nr:hypothetical protein [Candidatus Paceibacterota bacterium]